MKKVITLLVLTPIISFSQTYYDSALDLQNKVRDYYDLSPLQFDSNLSLKAQEWAEYIAETDQFEVSEDIYGENIFSIDKSYVLEKNKNEFLEATINWIIPNDNHDLGTFNQIVYPKCTKVGFGVAENHEYIYVVAKYDKLYK